MISLNSNKILCNVKELTLDLDLNNKELAISLVGIVEKFYDLHQMIDEIKMSLGCQGKTRPRSRYTQD